MDGDQREIIELLRDIRKHTRLLYRLAIAWIVILVICILFILFSVFLSVPTFREGSP
jgi:hypothetical protein